MSEQTTADVRPGRLFIGGEWVDPVEGGHFPTVNPATGVPLTDLAQASRADVSRAVEAARSAFEIGPWSKMDAAERQRLLLKLADAIEAHLEEIASLETLDNGKPIFESRWVDLPMVIDVFRYYAGWATKIHGETIPVRGPYLNYTCREPVGVVAAIIPWNFPLLMASWKVAPALAAGNTVVLKPAEQTSLTALRLAELSRDVGFPEGALNVLTGPGPEVGMPLVQHPGVDKIAFTGSTETGKSIMRESAETLKRVTLELGGKSPNIVLPDADLDAAVKGAYNGIFYGKGEVCAAGSRLFVHKSVHDEFLEKLVERTKRLQPGDPMHPKTRLGALVSEEQMNKVLDYVSIGREEGADLLIGGERTEIEDGGHGYFVTPAIFDRVDNGTRLAREEIFGPVLAAITYEDIDEVVAQANDNPYGLAAAVWTRDVARAHGIASRLKAGTVWINCYNAYDAAAPFGGFKQSGFGRDLGRDALEHYTETKDVWVNLKG